MTQKFTAEDIQQAVADIKKIKTEYSPLLDLYEKIFVAQEKSKEAIKLEEFVIEKDKLAIKLSEKFPLVNLSEFRYDLGESSRLFSHICDILSADENEISEAVKRIAALAETDKIDLAEVFTSFLKEDEDFFKGLEKEHQVDRQVLGFVVFNSLKPSLNVFAENLSGSLDSVATWEKGYCPVCGSAPEISLFEENGKRFMVCGFCGYKWASRRIYCPFCENSDHETLRYIEIEGEEEHRVDLCEKCKKYIKTINVTKTTGRVYPSLENQATTYIDLYIEDMGYMAGNIKTD